MVKRARAENGFDRSEEGFSLLELLVAVVIFSIVVLAIYALLEVGRSERFTTVQKTESIQNVRIALNTIGRDAINAGVGYENTGAQIPDNGLTLLNLAADANNENDSLTPVVSGNNINMVNGTATDQLTFLFIDETFNSEVAAAAAAPSAAESSFIHGHSLPINQLVDNGDEVWLNSPDGNGVTRVGDVYLIAGQTGWALGVLSKKSGANALIFKNGDQLGVNRPTATSPIRNIFPPNSTACGGNCIQVNASASRVNWVTYRVVDEDGQGLGSGTLVRRAWGGPDGWTDSPLAFGVENLQVQYILANGDVSDDPVAGPDRIAGNADDDLNFLQTVRQVVVSVTVRGSEIDRRTNQPIRSTLTSRYSTRNLVYEKQ
ncbi:MAG TPA: prepilin-type N-terminal cleavage/methylation domain-containing protein [Blastocatellia bacterium]|nr:prepilin-type N-terminal cleavage/methylation domain-containing protein [Blastocatellia bacterium]